MDGGVHAYEGGKTADLLSALYGTIFDKFTSALESCEMIGSKTKSVLKIATAAWGVISSFINGWSTAIDIIAYAAHSDVIHVTGNLIPTIAPLGGYLPSAQLGCPYETVAWIAEPDPDAHYTWTHDLPSGWQFSTEGPGTSIIRLGTQPGKVVGPQDLANTTLASSAAHVAIGLNGNPGGVGTGTLEAFVIPILPESPLFQTKQVALATERFEPGATVTARVQVVKCGESVATSGTVEGALLEAPAVLSLDADGFLTGSLTLQSPLPDQVTDLVFTAVLTDGTVVSETDQYYVQNVGPQVPDAVVEVLPAGLLVVELPVSDGNFDGDNLSEIIVSSASLQGASAALDPSTPADSIDFEHLASESGKRTLSASSPLLIRSPLPDTDGDDGTGQVTPHHLTVSVNDDDGLLALSPTTGELPTIALVVRNVAPEIVSPPATIDLEPGGAAIPFMVRVSDDNGPDDGGNPEHPRR